MSKIDDIKSKALAIKNATQPESISANDVGGTMYDMAEIMETYSELPEKVSNIEDGLNCITDTITPSNGGNAWISGNVGETLSFTEINSYEWKQYNVTEGFKAYVTLNRRNENFWWCYFTDASNTIISREIHSTSTDYSPIVDYLVTAPSGATKMYLNSFQPLNTLCAKKQSPVSEVSVSALNEAKNAQATASKSYNMLMHNCDYSTAGDYIETVLFEVEKGDVVTWLSSIAKENSTLYEYNSSKTVIDRWSWGIPRTITISNDNTAYISVRFSSTLDSKQYLVINDTKVSYITLSDINGMSNDIDEIKATLENGSTPSFVYSNGRDTLKRITEWGNGDIVYMLAQVTDVHSGGIKRYSVVSYINALNKIYNFDCLCNGGDIGLDTSDTTGDDEKVFELMFNTKKGMDCTSPWIFCKGNHERLVNLKTLGSLFNQAAQRHTQDIVFGDDYGNYGYIDNTVKKVRTYFLNTSDTTTTYHYAMTATQLNWLSSTLNNLGEGWKVIITTHLCIDSIGRWNSSPSDASGAYFDAMRSIFADFVNRRSGSNTSAGVSWDFTNAKALLVCNLAGDSHFNDAIKRDGVNYIVRQGYGSISDSEKPSSATRATVDWTTQCCFDVLAVKEDGNAKVFRIGAGGADYDYGFTFK